jgi:hypothetical protein
LKKNTKTILLATIGAILILAVIFVARDMFLGTATTIECGDGPRRRIDIRSFVTQYSAYSVDFEASVANKAKFSGKLNPVQLQELSEALQQANEFRKFLVAGYNSCAITKAQYAQFGIRFQALDGVSRQIDSLASQPDLAVADRARLDDLVKQYMELSEKLATE